MLIKSVLERRDNLRSYIYSISIAKNYCDIGIGNKKMVEDLEAVLDELQKEFDELDTSLKQIENIEM